MLGDPRIPGSVGCTLGVVEDFVRLRCPYCHELVEISLDPQTAGVFVQDCEVCCRPWQLFVRREEDGSPVVEVTRAQ